MQWVAISGGSGFDARCISSQQFPAGLNAHHQGRAEGMGASSSAQTLCMHALAKSGSFFETVHTTRRHELRFRRRARGKMQYALQVDI